MKSQATVLINQELYLIKNSSSVLYPAVKTVTVFYISHSESRNKCVVKAVHYSKME